MTSNNLAQVGRKARLPHLGLALGLAMGAGLVGATGGAADAGTATSQYGTLSAGDDLLPLPNRCGVYTYSYDLTPPDGEWAIETFVTDPRGNTVASYAALDHYSNGGTTATTSFTLCRNNTRPGVFTLSAIVSSDDGNGTVTSYQMTPATFTLAAPAPGTSAKALAHQRALKKKAAKKKAHEAAQKKRAHQKHRHHQRVHHTS